MNLLDNIITLPNIFTAIATILSVFALAREFRKDKNDIASGLLNDMIKVKDEIREHRDEIQAECECLKADLEKYKQEVSDARTELVCMNKDIMIMQKKLKNLRKGVSILLAQLSRHGLSPEWTPDKEDLE